MKTLRRPIAIVMWMFVAAGSQAAAQAPAQAKPVDRIGSYQLGDSIDKFKVIQGFEDDPGRDDAAAGVKAGKILGPFDGHPAIQRLYFKAGKLLRVSIIFGEPSFDEAKVKELIAAQWGDPGPRFAMKDGSKVFVWTGTKGIAMVVPADRGLWMASLGPLDR